MPYRCPRCGRETDYREELKGLCENCFREKYALPKLTKLKADIKICPVCGSVKLGNKWIKGNSNNISKVILSQIRRSKVIRGYDLRLELDQFTPTRMSEQLLLDSSATIPAELYKAGIKIRDISIELRVIKQVCPTCQKKAMGSYYEYVIHIRFSGKGYRNNLAKVNKLINQIASHMKSNVFIDVKKIKRGLDIRISDRETGRRLLNKLIRMFNTEARQYFKKKYDPSLNKNILIRKAMIEI